MAKRHLCAGTHSSGYKDPGKNEETPDGTRQEATLGQMDTRSKRAVMKAVDGKTSGWLNVLPIARHQFDLSAVVF